MAAKIDLVIFGATGFTGRLAALYVTKQYGDTIKWAIAGRSKDKLEAIRTECRGIPEVIIADSGDEAALSAMCAKTKVVCSFAGPFTRYGNKLVAACVAAGIDYCDITGEIHWVQEVITKYDDAAKKSGARIINLTGCDSLPWDMMTFMLTKKLKEGNPSAQLKRVDYWDHCNIELSGGTFETVIGTFFGSDAKKSDEVKAVGFDPLLKKHGVAGASEFQLINKNVLMLEGADKKKGHSMVRGNFLMADINASAVQRSNALNGYGKNVVYREGQSFESKFKALQQMAAFVVLLICLAIPPIRYLMRKFVLPRPGEGPSEEFMQKGFLHVTGVATGTDDRTAKATLTFPVDPAYKDTARMCIESGLTLALDSAKLHNKSGGVRTPAACQGEAVLHRLLATGCSFEYH